MQGEKKNAEKKEKPGDNVSWVKEENRQQINFKQEANAEEEGRQQCVK